MDNIVLISCFCNNEEKLNTLKHTLITLNKHNLTSALISPIPIPEEITKLSNYTFITKENPVLDWPVKSLVYWSKISNYKVFTTVPDWGWAGLNHVKRLGEIFINYDYNFYNYIIYDTILTPEVISVLKTGHKGIFFPSKRKDQTWKVGLHLASFNKDTLKKVLEKLTLKSYLKYNGWEAYDFIYDYIVQPLKLPLSDMFIEDSISFNVNEHLINHSPISDFNLFISSPDYKNAREMGFKKESVKILFSNLNNAIKIKIKVNENSQTHVISNGTLFNTKFLKKDINHLSLEYNNKTYNLTERLLDLKHTRVTIYG